MVIQNKRLRSFVVRKNNNKFEKSKIFALFFTSIVLIGLVLSGPANALIIGSDVKDSDGVKEFTLWLNPNSGDKLAVSELKLQIDGVDNCIFNVDGSIVSGCNGITIEKIVSPDKPGNGPKPGYGYGYGYENANNDRLAYKITLNTAGLTGNRMLKFLVKIGKGNKYFSKEIPFSVESNAPIPAVITEKNQLKNNNQKNNKPGKNK